MTARSGGVYRFDGFEVDIQNLRLTAAGENCSLEPKSFRLLHFLIENQGRTVPKDEIVAAVWPSTFVSDNSITRAVTRIRKALHDDAKEPKYIETVPTVGYRFIGDAKTILPADRPSPAAGVSRPQFSRRAIVLATAATVLVVTSMGAWWYARYADSTLRPVKVTKFTQLAGQQTDPAFSPDGRFVAFSWGQQGGYRDIYAMAVGGGSPVRLTQDSANDMSPAWSPDGKQIAFLRLESVLKASVVVIPSGGGAELTVRQVSVSEGIYRSMRPLLTWTPDGNRIIYIAQDDELERGGAYVTDLDGKTSRKLFDAPEKSSGIAGPAISPDRKSLAYTVVYGPHQARLYVRPLREGLMAQDEPFPITEVPGSQITCPVWSPGGKRLLFMQDSAIFEWTAGRSPRQIYAGVSMGSLSAAWGPGTALRIVTGDANYSETDRAELWTIPLRSGGLAASGESVPFGAAVAQSTPRFSPEGKLVAFRSPSSGSNEVWVADANGQNARQLTHLKTGVGGFLRWSPDGRQLAFHASANSKPQIFILDLDRVLGASLEGTAGNTPKLITDSAFGFFAPTWSADAKYIYADRTTGGSRIFRIPVAGGQPEELFEGATSIVTPDGHKIVYAKIGHLGIFSRSLDGDVATNPEEKLVDDYRPPGSDLNPVADGVYYVSWNGANNPRAIRFYSYAQRRSVDIVSPPGRIPDSPGLAVSPDRRQLVYAQLTATVKNLTLLEFQ